jgi:hypothetical protein
MGESRTPETNRITTTSKDSRMEVGRNQNGGIRRFKVKGKLAPRYVGLYKIISYKGEVAYPLKLPPQLLDVHDVFHMSQVKK